jgi:hypothetical protein
VIRPGAVSPAGATASGATSGAASGEGSWAAPARGRSALLALLSLAVAAVIYGPMLRPGFPLRYDLVSVPGPVLGEDALGLGDRLPRAVPLDAATAVLARLLPDAWLTQLLALLALTLAGWGVAVLTPAPLPGRLLALLVAEWNPFVLEQLAIGHIPHLFAYGALPWVAIFGRSLVTRDRGGGRAGSVRDWAGLTATAGFGSLTPGGGVLCAIAALAGLAAGMAGSRAGSEPGRSGRGRRALAGVVTVGVLQLPWLIAAVAAPAFSAPAGPGPGADGQIAAFALRSETGWGRLVDAAGLAGMWNGSALPTSRHTVLARVSTVLLLGLAAAGLSAVRRLWRAGRRPELLAAGAAGGLGYLVAVLPVLPGGTGLLQALIDDLPGAGLLRDGHRWLALPAIVVAVLCGLGVSELAALVDRRLDRSARSARSAQPAQPGLRGLAVVLFAALLVPASMPDLAGGLGGRLQARHFPAQWAQARAVLDHSDDRARVLVLPWQPFRIFGWSGPDPVLDPAPRLLPRQSIVSDALTVSGRRLPEEGLGARAVAADLADGGLSAPALRSLAVGWVLIERGTPGPVPALPSGWTTVLNGPDLVLLRAPGVLPSAPRAGPARSIAVIGSQALAGLLLLLALLMLALATAEGHARRPFRGGPAPV